MKHRDKINWDDLIAHAWDVRENASIIGKTKVGAAVLTESNKIFSGCNVEQTYRNHDVHAEVNAITNMISNGEKRFVAILIVADRERFTPCGSCLDWIFQFGGPECIVAFQSNPLTEMEIFRAKELMPHYPF